MKPTGTSSKFANMTEQALVEFEGEYGVKFDKITKIPLEGDGTIERRVERYFFFFVLFLVRFFCRPTPLNTDSTQTSKPTPNGSLIYTTQTLSSWLRIRRGLLCLRISWIG